MCPAYGAHHSPCQLSHINHQSEKPASSDLARGRDNAPFVDPDERIAALTDNERHALRIFISKSDVKEIGRELGKSPHTVEKYLASARTKLGVRRSLDAAHILAQAEGNPVYGRVVYRPSAVEAPTPDLLSRRHGRPWNAIPRWSRAGIILGGLLVLVVVMVLAVNIADTLARLDRY